MKHWAGATPPNRPEGAMETMMVGIILLCGVVYIYAVIRYIDDYKERGGKR